MKFFLPILCFTMLALASCREDNQPLNLETSTEILNATDRDGEGNCTPCFAPYDVCIFETCKDSLIGIQHHNIAFRYYCPQTGWVYVPVGSIYGWDAGNRACFENVMLPINVPGYLCVQSGCAGEFCPVRVCLTACGGVTDNGALIVPFWSECFNVNPGGPDTPATLLHCMACE